MAYSNDQITSHINSLKSSGLSGDALAKQIYSDAQKFGVNSGQVATAMGTTESNVNNWITQNNKNPLTQPSSTGNTSTAGQGLLQQPSSGASSAAGSSNSIPSLENPASMGQIQDHISWLQSDQGLTGEALYNQAYRDAQKYGVGSVALEQAMGWKNGTVNNWISSNGLQRLTADQEDEQLYIAPATWQAAAPSLGSVQVNQTVSGQLNDLLSQDSPLMQRARYQGMATANNRGLLNSSLAAGAAQAAMIDSALPVAQQDAQTYYNQARANQDATNQFNLTNLQYLQGAEQAALDRAFDLTQTEYKTNAQLAQSMAETRLTQSSGLYAQFIQGMADINSSDMDQSAKDVALRSLWETISKGTELSTSLANVTFANGQLVYGGDAGNAANIITPPTSRSEDQPSIYWGDGGYYEPNVTRNSAEQLVDREGATKPEGNYYLNDNGEWKPVYSRSSRNDD